MWTSFVIFNLSQATMLVVGAIYDLLFTGVPGTATYYATIATIYTWVKKKRKRKKENKEK
jgi:methane/ammonia monooxygenase subunit A